MNLIHGWLCRSGWWKKRLERQVMPWVLKDVNLGDDVLEVGPGPGLTTDLLRRRFTRITSLEIDPALARGLQRQVRGSNVRVVNGDATALPFPNESFSGVICLTMLHHVPSPELQDRLFAEAHRCLRPGGAFIGVDSTWSRTMQLIHVWDTLVPVDPKLLESRLKRAGFRETLVEVVEGGFRWAAHA